MPKCKINGKEVEVPAGSSIIQAFKASGEDIAHYCWHPGLSVAGVCRLCMVDIEGNPKMQIACNTTVAEGMVITNRSEKVKDTVKWGLDFHLINHPLDCPICDQAGECGLQDQYMQFGKYEPEMAERKVKKHKVVDLGPTVMLDTERCILCSRCVRFTEEVSKTRELGIFNRGDRSEIGTFEGKPLNNKYSLNTVDICPVGALTSKDFRFRQRVWYLKEAKSICTSCSTGCNVTAYYNEEGAWRVRPRLNEKVNGYWMCDEGRDIYKYVNKKSRLLTAKISKGSQVEALEAGAAVKKLAPSLKAAGDRVALVITGQYTNEENEAILQTFAEEFKSKQVYHWINNPDQLNEFDGLLLRGDRNPNTQGLKQSLEKSGIKSSWDDLSKKIQAGSIQTLIVAGPENQVVFPDIAEKAKLFEKVSQVVWLTACPNPAIDAMKTEVWQIPLKTYIEKSGTFVNYQGLEQKIRTGTIIVSSALTLKDVADLLAGREITFEIPEFENPNLKVNHFTEIRGTL